MNTFGKVFRFTTWGESHGMALGCVIDGCPAGLELSEEDIQIELQKEIPDGELGTPRKEANIVKIYSGVFEGKTIGTPISAMIFNENHNSSNYEYLRHYYRPGHAEYTFHKRYGIYNHYGGGRASGRECITRMICGAVAKKILDFNRITFESNIEELNGIKCTSKEQWEEARRHCIESEDSTGGVISLRITGVPAGVGSPIFGKLSASIVHALSTIGGVKGIEIGLGFDSARLKGSQYNDRFDIVNGEILPITNHAGGFLGGISTGNDLVFKIAVKPTPSIALEQQTVNWKNMKTEKISVRGRFDKNFAPRIMPVAESMAACVLVDQMILSGYIDPVQIGKGGVQH